MLIGMVGAICFGAEMITFQLDWVGRYNFLLFLIPVPFICIIFAKKLPLICGTILFVLGILVIFFHFIFPVGIIWNKIGVWNQLGLGTINTIFFVSMPLVISGIMFINSKRLKKHNVDKIIGHR